MIWHCPCWDKVRAPYLVALRSLDFEWEPAHLRQKSQQDEPRISLEREGTPALWWFGLANGGPGLRRLKGAIPQEDLAVPTTAPEPTAAPAEEVQYEMRGGVRRRLVATNGSGLCPTDERLGRCGWGVFHARNSPRNRAELLNCPILVVPRAELKAVIYVAQTLTEPTTTLCDCAFVVDGAAKLARRGPLAISSTRT